MQVIGIDPGLINTGWAVIEEDGPKIKFMGSGICRLTKKRYGSQIGIYFGTIKIRYTDLN